MMAIFVQLFTLVTGAFAGAEAFLGGAKIFSDLFNLSSLSELLEKLITAVNVF